MMLALAVFAVPMLVPAAQAGPATCDALAMKADSLEGAALAKAYGEVARCSKKSAEAHFPRFMSQAKDSDALVALSLIAIDWETWNPVWNMLGKVTSYEARDEVAQRIGETCAEREKVVPFLEGAYFGLRDIEFQQWDDALIACQSTALDDWMKQQIEAPPEKLFDEKYNALATVFVRRQRAAALPHLAKGAIAAAPAGPYDAILMQMDAAVAAEFGASIGPEDQKALEKSLVSVARAVGPEKARAVADRLFNAGSTEAAAGLLQVIYSDRRQGGAYLYGAASIEAGECEGKKTAVLHVAHVSEPGKRWVILEDIESPMRAFKPKLGKCKTDEPWPVATTPEPVKGTKDIDAWVKGLTDQWKGQGYEVTTKTEKDVELP